MNDHDIDADALRRIRSSGGARGWHAALKPYHVRVIARRLHQWPWWPCLPESAVDRIHPAAQRSRGVRLSAAECDIFIARYASHESAGAGCRRPEAAPASSFPSGRRP